jgi:hypothetical protein
MLDPMRTTSLTLAAALADSPAAPLLARLAATRAAVAVIAAAVAELTPDLDLARPGTADIQADVLLIHATSAAQAAKLRQAIPSLLALLQQRDLDLSQIRLRVQPGGPSEPAVDLTQISHVPTPAHAPGQVAAAARFAKELAALLPDSPLRRAAQKLRRSLASDL